MRGAMYSMMLTARQNIRFYLQGGNANGYPLVRFTELEPDTEKVNKGSNQALSR